MEMQRYDEGVHSWVDIGTDVAGATAFYGSLFGWEVEDAGPDAGGYAIARLRGKRVCGLGPQQSPGPPYWTTYVNVANADDTVAKVRANGGMVFVEPMDVMDQGRMAICADPSGAAFGLWQPMAHTGAELVNEPGTWSWSELQTRDLAAATAFYAAVFGWTPNDHGGYVEWELGGRTIGGMMATPEGVPAEVPSAWQVYFTVDGTDAALTRIGELGGSTLMGPMDIAQGRIATCLDPQGAVFNVITMAG